MHHLYFFFIVKLHLAASAAAVEEPESQKD